MSFPGFDMLALGIIFFVALREAGYRVHRIRAAQRDLEPGPVKA